MPSISTDKKGNGRIRWDRSDWDAGLVNDWGLSNQLRHSDATGLGYMVGMDPFREPGYIMPGFEPTNSTNSSVVDGVLTGSAQVGSVAYPVGGTKVHEMTVTNGGLTNAGSFPHVVTPHGGHTTPVAQDAVIYYIGSTRYLFYSWKDSVDGDIGRFDLTSTFDDDWVSTVPASGAVLGLNTHPLIVNNRDMLLVGDGNIVRQLDGQTGANGTWSAVRFSLPKDYVITSFSKTANYTVIFAYRSSGEVSGTFNRSECTAFFWDELSDNPTYRTPIEGNYINGGFTFQGAPGCFVQGRTAGIAGNKISKMMIGGPSGFKPFAHFIHDIPGHGGVETFDSSIMWNSDGEIYRYGSSIPGLAPSLNHISKLDGTTGEGICRNFFGNTFMASAGTTTSGGSQRLAGSYYPGSFFTTLAHPSFPMEKQGRVTRIKVYWMQSTEVNANDITISLNFEGGTNQSVIVNALDTIASNKLVTEYTVSTDDKNLPTFKGLMAFATYSANTTSAIPPMVQAIEVYYETINITG